MARRRLPPSTLPPYPPAHPAAAYIAWRRKPGEQWARVGGGGTVGEAWERLWEAMKRTGSGDFESVILARGNEP